MRQVTLAIALLCAPAAGVAANAPVNTVEWHGVVAFMNNPDKATEDWNKFTSQIHSACLEYGASWAYGNPLEKRVSIGPRRDVVDVSSYLRKPGQGWLLVRNGGVVRTLIYGPAARDEAIRFCETGSDVTPGAVLPSPPANAPDFTGADDR